MYAEVVWYDGEHLPFDSGSFDAIYTSDVLGHVQNVPAWLKELNRVLKPGGVLIVASPFIFPIHDLPNDYWRFTPKALTFLMKDFSVKLVGTHADPIMPHTVYGIGFIVISPVVISVCPFIVGAPSTKSTLSSEVNLIPNALACL